MLTIVRSSLFTRVYDRRRKLFILSPQPPFGHLLPSGEGFWQRPSCRHFVTTLPGNINFVGLKNWAVGPNFSISTYYTINNFLSQDKRGVGGEGELANHAILDEIRSIAELIL